MSAPRVALLSLWVLAGCASEDNFIRIHTPPAATILHPPDGSMFYEGETIVFRGRVADGGNVEALDIEWSSSLDGLLFSNDIPDPHGEVEMAVGNLSLGEHLVTLRAFDDHGFAADAHVTVGIETVPEYPTLEIESPAPGEVGVEPWDTDPPGHPYDFRFATTVWDYQDPPEALVVELEADTVGPICTMTGPDSYGYASCVDSLPVGEHLLTFSVEDTDGHVTTRTRLFEVIPRGDHDHDGDGYTPNQGDCDDYDPQVNPGATQVCGSGIDNNCSGTVNEQDAIGCTTYLVDADGDGFGPAGGPTECWCEPTAPFTAPNSPPYDCDDNNANAFPGQTQWFTSPRANGTYDYNCNGSEERRWTQISTCYFSNFSCSGNPGWDSGGIPHCGSSAVWSDQCSFDWATLVVGCGAPCLLVYWAEGEFNNAVASCLANNCPGAMMCDPDAGSRTQACR